MDKKIKDFFAKKKSDLTFKRAGSGHRLNADSNQQTQQAQQSSSSIFGRILGNGQPVSEPSSSTNQPKRQAGPDENVAKATLARLETKPNSATAAAASAVVNKSTLYDIMAEEKQKFEKELKLKEAMEEQKQRRIEEEQQQNKALENPYKPLEEVQRFTCETLNLNNPLPFKDLMREIKSCIYDNFNDDPILRSAMVIFNCNRSIEDGSNQSQPNARLKNCLDILMKIISNIVTAENAEQLEKFKRIRRSKIEQKILSLDGTLDFMFAINFTIDDKDNDWFVYVDDEDLDDDQARTIARNEKLNYVKDLLANPQIIPIELDRQIKTVVDQSSKQTDNDDDIKVTASDLKELQSHRERVRQIDELFVSRETKAKLLNPSSSSNFRSIFTKLRFKFELTDEMQIIEAMFYSNETLGDVKKWFTKQYGDLMGLDGRNLQFKYGLTLLDDLDRTLECLQLTPAATLLVIVC